MPTYELQSIKTDFGWIGSSGEQRVRELAANSPKVMELHPELRDKVEKKREGKYEYFRYRRDLSPIQYAAIKCARFDAGLPAEQVFA